MTGSHVDCDEFSLAIGFGKLWDCSSGKCSASIFVEGATGRYTSTNDFPTGRVSGSGDSRALGLGLSLRMDGNGSENGHFYGEGSVHGGRIKHDFSSSDIVNGMGVRASYSSTAAYYGVHGGIGYVLEVGDAVSLDAYGKYIWIRKAAKDVSISTGETVRFKNADSQRLLTGLRLSRRINPTVTVYMGGACSYELAGKIRAETGGLNIDAPSLRGASAIAEIGICKTWNSNVLSFAVHGYAGKRRGADASLSFERKF
jgi:hypothetical protein